MGGSARLAARREAAARSSSSTRSRRPPDWSGAVKRLWDEDTAGAGRRSRSCCSARPRCSSRAGSRRASPGASRSCTFRTGRLPRCARRSAGPSTSSVFYGGYPGAAPLVRDHARWARYVIDSLIETTISRDVLLLSRVDKPALLRRLFELGCRYSGQILSYTKMLGQLQDAGNTTTLAHYLDLLAGAGMVDRAPEVRGRERAAARLDPEAAGAQHRADDRASPASRSRSRDRPRRPGGASSSPRSARTWRTPRPAGECELFYWRDRNREVDFVDPRGPRARRRSR